MIREHYDLSVGDQTLCITLIHVVKSLDESLVERSSDREMQRYKTISDWASSSRKSKLHLPSDDVNYSAIWH